MDGNIDQMPHVIVRGNPVEGLWIEGPYADHDAAMGAAVGIGDSDWWVTPLHPAAAPDDQAEVIP